MKKIVLISLLFLVSCKNSNVKTQAKKYRINRSSEIQIIEVDKCEYLYLEFEVDRSALLIHKGNCKNHSNKNIK